MSIERAEQLKKQLTDQWVRIASPAPELKRFANSVGQVRTVNMNCRALVEFFGDKDDSWYDIAPEFLTITDKPEQKPISKVPKSLKSAVVQPDSANQVALEATEPSRSQQSPLDKIRNSSATKAAAVPTAKSVDASESSKSLTPAEQIRAESKKRAD